MQLLDVAANADAPDAGGKMQQIQITLPKRVLDGIKAEARKLHITPNMIIRLWLLQQRGERRVSSLDGKSYTLHLDNWREVEAYLKIKSPELSVADFAVRAVGSLMRRNGLTRLKKPRPTDLSITENKPIA